MRNELKHHGILGQRWGIRRYQRKDGSLTPLGKKHLQALEREDPETYEQAKQNAIRSGDAAQVKAWSKMLTQQELMEAVNRIDREKKLNDLLKEKGTIEKGMDYVDKFAKYADTINKAYTGYANLKKIKDAFSGDKDDDTDDKKSSSGNITKAAKAVEKLAGKDKDSDSGTDDSNKRWPPSNDDRPPRYKYDKEAYDKVFGKHYDGYSLGVVGKKNKHVKRR